MAENKEGPKQNAFEGIPRTPGFQGPRLPPPSQPPMPPEDGRVVMDWDDEEERTTDYGPPEPQTLVDSQQQRPSFGAAGLSWLSGRVAKPMPPPPVPPPLARPLREPPASQRPVPTSLRATELSGEGDRTTQKLKQDTLLKNRFRINSHMARGGFADIYVARDEFLDNVVVLKIPYSVPDEGFLEQLVRRTCAVWDRLCDAAPGHVVRLKEVATLDLEGVRTAAMVMEHMAGGTVAEFVHHLSAGHPRNHQQLSLALSLFLQGCRAVLKLHTDGLLHRDLKPGNFLLNASRTVCKLADFESVVPIGGTSNHCVGTKAYLAPECRTGSYSFASEVFALGATLFELLTGDLPFEDRSGQPRQEAPLISDVNPIVPEELSFLIARCLDEEPARRPQTVGDLVDDLARMGIDDQSAATAPSGLARVLLSTLADDDIDYLTTALERRGFSSARTDDEARRLELIEEYCYTASPDDVLNDNCTGRQLAGLAAMLDLQPSDVFVRAEQVNRILAALGFVSAKNQPSGIESCRTFLVRQSVDLQHASSLDEVLGLLQSSLGATERVIELLVWFYGQLLYGSGVRGFLSGIAEKKGYNRLTFGQKSIALQRLCSSPPDVLLGRREASAFTWPLLDEEFFRQLGSIVQARNDVMHGRTDATLVNAISIAKDVLTKATELISQVATSRHAPTVIQVIGRQQDIYGRHSFLARDDSGHLERIFTTLRIEVGGNYLFYPLTEPVRVNPILFPLRL